MNADPKQSPKKRFEIMHGIVMLAAKSTDSHEDLRTSLARRFKRFDIVCLDCEVEVDKKAFVLLFGEYNISSRDITMQNANVQ